VDLVHPQNWRWQAVAFFSFPAILLVPTAILRLLGMSVISPQFSGTVLVVCSLWCFHLLSKCFLHRCYGGTRLARISSSSPTAEAFAIAGKPCCLASMGRVACAARFYGRGWTTPWMNYVQVRVIFFRSITIHHDVALQSFRGEHSQYCDLPCWHEHFSFLYCLTAPPVLGLIFVWAGYAVIADKMWRQQKGRR